MIFHTVYSITCDDFAFAFDNPKIARRIPIWLPEKVILKGFARLVNKWNKISNKDNNNNVLNEIADINSFECKIQSLHTVFLILKNYWLTFEIPEEALIIFKKYIGHDFDPNDFINETQRVVKRLDKMRDTLKMMVQNMEAPKSKKGSFKDLLMITDDLCNKNGALGSIKLYKLPYFIDKADKIIKSREHGRN